MSRWDSSTNATEAANASVTVVVLVDLDLASGHVYAHDGIGSLTHDGNTYEGVGKFGGIELDTEDHEVAAKGARLILSGIPADLTPDVLTVAGYQGRNVTLYIGFLNSETGTWIDTPEVLWSGFMDYIDIETGADGATVILHVEDELRKEPLQAWYTDEDQQLLHSGDRFFSDLPNVERHQATWGRSSQGFGGVVQILLSHQIRNFVERLR